MMMGHRKQMHVETTKCSWCHHYASVGLIPQCTCSYMAYIWHRTFIAPQGADCSGRQTESWDPWCTFPLCALTSNSPPPCAQQTAPTLPWAEGLSQLHSTLRSSGGTAAEAPCDLLSNSAAQNTRSTSCVWVLLKYCSTYIMKSTLLSSAALPRGVGVFLAPWCGIADIMEVVGRFVFGSSVPVSISGHFRLWICRSCAKYLILCTALIEMRVKNIHNIGKCAFSKQQL